MSKSSKSPRARKPDRPKKPYPEFPLTPHASGTWQKKINGKTFYFGRWAKRVNGTLERIEGDGWKEALDEYKAVADDLHAGRTPRVKGDGLTVKDLCNAFLTAKTRKKEAGELGSRMFADYRLITDVLVETFGSNRLVDDLAADDFGALRAKMARKWGPVRLGNSIIRAKSVFKFGIDNGLIERMVRFGSEFKKPNATVMRLHRVKAGEKMFEAAELRKIIEAASVTFKAMTLLGVNCGFGNWDCATLTISAANLDRGWLEFPRPKTGIPRRCPLWPETVEAIRAVIAERPKPAGYEECGLLFLNRRGSAWVQVRDDNRSDKIAVGFKTLLDNLELHRKGFGFYTLRHTFRTIADAARDPVAIDAIMGHADHTMGARYRERIEDSRLKAVTDHVHAWLFPKAETSPPPGVPAPVTD